jgi:hypothetical protein
MSILYHDAYSIGTPFFKIFFPLADDLSIVIDKAVQDHYFDQKISGECGMKRFMGNKRLLPALVITSGLLYVVSQATILAILEPMGISPLMFQLSFDSNSLADIITAWGDNGIELFRKHFYMDFLHPVIYSSFQFFLLCYLRSKLRGYGTSRDIPAYFLLPFAAAAIDLAENFLELAIIRRGTEIPGWMAFANGLLSSSKWALAAISIGIIALLIIRLAVYSIQSRKGTTI